MGLQHFLDSGALGKHIQAVSDDLKERRDFLCQKLEELDLEFVKPDGGYFVWVKAKGRRIGRLGESMTIHEDKFHDHMRLCFSWLSKD
ncbi:HERC1, partial [Symbiodinium pilosum]